MTDRRGEHRARDPAPRRLRRGRCADSGRRAPRGDRCGGEMSAAAALSADPTCPASSSPTDRTSHRPDVPGQPSATAARPPARRAGESSASTTAAHPAGLTCPANSSATDRTCRRPDMPGQLQRNRRTSRRPNVPGQPSAARSGLPPSPRYRPNGRTPLAPLGEPVPSPARSPPEISHLFSRFHRSRSVSAPAGPRPSGPAAAAFTTENRGQPDVIRACVAHGPSCDEAVVDDVRPGKLASVSRGAGESCM